MKFKQITQAVAITAIFAAAAGPAFAGHARGGEDPAVTAEGVAQGAAAVIVPNIVCPAGFFSVGATLCMTGAQGPDTFANALARCQSLNGAVAGYGAWRYRVLYGDGVAAPLDWWLGPITADDRALYVNSTNTGNFDGETSRFDIRFYACSKG